MTTLSLLTLLGRIFDPLAALLDEAADTAKTPEAAKFKLAALKAEAWGFLQIGLGGYAVGRSVESVVPQITASLDQKRGFI